MKVLITAVLANKDGLKEMTTHEEHSSIGRVFKVISREGEMISASEVRKGWSCARLSDGFGSWFVTAFRYEEVK